MSNYKNELWVNFYKNERKITYIFLYFDIKKNEEKKYRNNIFFFIWKRNILAF